MTDGPRTYSGAEMRACIVRELGFRRRVFPRRVEQGQMTRREMDHEIAVMEAVLERFPPEPDLFAAAEKPSMPREADYADKT